MATRPRKQGDADDAPEPRQRQLGLGLLWPPAPPPPPAPAPALGSPVSPPPRPPAPVPVPVTVPVTLAAAAAPLPVSVTSPPIPTEPPPRRPEPPPAPRIFKVTDLVRAARLTLESRFADVRVEGEVSGSKRSGQGHIYFSLKDDQSSVDCVMYAREASRLRFRLEDGMAVRVRGRVTIYEGRGRFQLTALEVEPTGAGALAVAFEQLKQKLEAEGLFAAARKRPLPFLPRCLGVVTSRDGAVIRDIIRVAHRRFPVHILLAPAPVQGPGAALAIAAALGRLGRVDGVDAVIVARGGGSMEDLWAFNEEVVARAIAAAPVPVISAVGHETDFTIADFVADLRAPTPSAAAERAVPVMADLRAEIALYVRRAGRGAEARLGQARLGLERSRSRLGDPRRLVNERRQLLDDLAARAERPLGRRLARHRAELGAAELALHRAHPRRRIADQRALLAALGQAVADAGRRALGARRGPFESLSHKLDALSPRRVLERGYSLAFRADGHVLTRAADVAAGDHIRVALRDGEIAAAVVSSSSSDGDGGEKKTS